MLLSFGVIVFFVYNIYLFLSKFLANSILNTMDIGLSGLSPHGVNFMPLSPPPQALSDTIDCWPEGTSLNKKFIDMVLKKHGNCLLTPLKHLDYWYYLNNHLITQYSSNKAQCWCQAQDKHWALSFFELQDSQVYQ